MTRFGPIHQAQAHVWAVENAIDVLRDAIDLLDAAEKEAKGSLSMSLHGKACDAEEAVIAAARALAYPKDDA